MPNSVTLITQRGLDELKTELNQLQEQRRPEVVNRLSIARSMGDLSENSDYISAKEELSFLDSRIDELEEMIKNAKVAQAEHSSIVGFGHTVTVKLDTAQTSFQIVGEPEADPSKRLISHLSPLGQALMGKKVGDKVEVDAPVGKVVYSIVAIA